MSLTLATVADALIEFILSLLRDPDLAAEFDDEPDQVLAARGLQHASPADVAAVAPVIIERTQVMHVAVPKPIYIERDHSQVVREIKQVTSNFQWVDDRDTVIDQSVNQNIWAEGDVTQTFDNEAIVASGDDAVAAGHDATVDKTWDESTTIEAGDDVNIGNQTDVEIIDDSLNEDTDASTTTEEPTVVVVEDSFTDESTQAQVDDSFNQTETITDTSTTMTDTDVQTVPADATTTAETVPEEQAVTEQPEQPVEDVYDSAAQYTEADLGDDAGEAFTDVEQLSMDESAADDTY